MFSHSEEPGIVAEEGFIPRGFSWWHLPRKNPTALFSPSLFGLFKLENGSFWIGVKQNNAKKYIPAEDNLFIILSAGNDA